MAKLVWDEMGEKLFETGVNKAALFVYDPETKAYKNGVAWNGISGITESPSGAEANSIYADNIKYLNLYSAEELGATIEAYMYPDEFALCDGSAELVEGVMAGQAERKTFALAYETLVGNDTEGQSHGKKLHIIYGCKVSPSEKAYTSVNDSPEAISFSWTVTTTPVPYGTDNKTTANVVIDSTKMTAENFKKIEDAIYGSAEADSKVLLPDEIVALIKAAG